MEEFKDSLDNEKGTWLIGMIAKCDTLKAHFFAEGNRIHKLPLAVVAAQIHLGLLRERLQSGTKFGLGDNTVAWHKDLKTKIEDYRQYFRSTLDEWLTWRRSQIKTRFDDYEFGTAPYHHVYLKDSFTSQKEFFYDKSIHPDFTDRLTARIMADATAGMTSILSPTFYFHCYLPEWEQLPALIDPKLFDMRVGPYSDATMETDNFSATRQGDSMWTTDVPDPPLLMATKAVVRHYNSIDALQFFYGATEGHFVGSSTGGERREFAAPAGINGVRLSYNHYSILRGLQFLAGDKTSEVYGMFHRGDQQPGNQILLDSDYKLCSAEFRKGDGPSNTTGIRVLKLRFRHKDTLAANQVRSVKANRVLDVPVSKPDDGLEIILYTSNGGTNQLWNRIYTGNDTNGNALWVLMNVATSKVLNLNEQTGKLIQWPRSDGSNNELWIFQKAADGNWRIISKANGRALTATAEGTLTLGSVSEDSTQLWQLA